MLSTEIENAAKAILCADSLLIIAGAGMGVDSRLPDFRGNKGFWKAHPNFESEQLSFEDLANPQWFITNPQRAWGFYGHRHQLYKRTNPHQGFDILKQWCTSKFSNSFIYTTNVDGHFQKSGFSESMVYECHGSINHLQCISNCTEDIWFNDQPPLEINEQHLLATGQPPHCIHCNGLARPNILMFYDDYWLAQRSKQQSLLFKKWIELSRNKTVAIIEIGAGTSGCSARYASQNAKGTLIRINPVDTQNDNTTIAIKLGGLEALRSIHELVDSNTAPNSH